jgi:sugar phosphate isomerase/epimerase
MSPYIAREAMLCEMAKIIRDFETLPEFVQKLRAAGYTDIEIIEHGGDVWLREKARQAIIKARAA